MSKSEKNVNIGDVFGRLTIISKDEERSGKNTYYLCKCICGNEKSVMRSNLTSGNTVSCGCFRKERPSTSPSKAKDMLGQKIGKLLVKCRGHNTSKGQAQWWCLCDCGSIKLIEGSSLRTENTSSCGCKRIQTIKSKLSTAENLIGRKFGKLTVLSRGPNDKKKAQWNCICECGKTALKKADNLRRGIAKSCGCLELANRLKNCSKRIIKHGLYEHPLYYKFHSMKARCLKEKSKDYLRYGGRGIKICKEWLDAPEKFIEWAIKSGWKKEENLSIDRIDNDGDYSPENCRVIGFVANTLKRFTDRNQGLVVSGKTINILELKRKSGISPNTIKNLSVAGYNSEDILEYGKLAHFQKIVVSKSIRNDTPMIIQEAAKLEKICKVRIRPIGYTNYTGMMGRCYNTNNKHYSNYGERGITVCSQWNKNFKQFINDMGPPPYKDAAIHRINNDGNYEPSNCQWTSRSENTRAMHLKNK